MHSPRLPKPPVYRVIVAQAVMTLCLALVMLLVVDGISAKSALLGGVICFVPNAYLVRHAFMHSGARAAKKIVNSFYKGEAGKFLLTACGFALVFTLIRPLNAMVLFGAFAVVQAVHAFVPLFLKNRVS